MTPRHRTLDQKSAADVAMPCALVETGLGRCRLDTYATGMIDRQREITADNASDLQGLIVAATAQTGRMQRDRHKYLGARRIQLANALGETLAEQSH